MFSRNKNKPEQLKVKDLLNDLERDELAKNRIMRHLSRPIDPPERFLSNVSGFAYTTTYAKSFLVPLSFMENSSFF